MSNYPPGYIEPPTKDEMDRLERKAAAELLQLQSEIISAWAANIENRIETDDINSAFAPEYRIKAAEARSMAAIMFRAAELELKK